MVSPNIIEFQAGASECVKSLDDVKIHHDCGQDLTAELKKSIVLSIKFWKISPMALNHPSRSHFKR